MPLPERVTSLLTAYIDGELSSRKRRAVDRLLRKSPEARNLLSSMQQDSMILRHLPRKKMKADLSKTVLTTLDLRGIKLPPPPPMTLPPLAPRTSRWPKVIGAVLLLVAIGTGSYFFFSATAPATHRKGPPTSTSPAEHTMPDKGR
jgi:anti-sigma factor RsiW